MGHSLGFMLQLEPSSLRPGGQRAYNGATQVGGARWPFHHPLFSCAHWRRHHLQHHCICTLWYMIQETIVCNLCNLCSLKGFAPLDRERASAPAGRLVPPTCVSICQHLV